MGKGRHHGERGDARSGHDELHPQRQPCDGRAAREEFKVNGSAPTFKTPQQGAATSVLVAVSPQLRGIGGRYFEDSNEAIPVANNNGYGSGVALYALDPANADRLWDESMRHLGLDLKAAA